MDGNKRMSQEKHTFSFYYQSLSALELDAIVVIDDEQLVHRLRHVIRLQPGDVFVLFDQVCHGLFHLAEFDGKKRCKGILSNKSSNLILQPDITFLLPILKPDALHDAVYSLAEVGVSIIQLVTTSKSVQKVPERHMAKLCKVAIAAAEQSKQYAFSMIKEPMPLTDAVQQYEGKKFYFDVSGDAFSSWYNSARAQRIVLLTGPEGDLTGEEKNIVKQSGFRFVALTETILRSVRAISLASALFRL